MRFSLSFLAVFLLFFQFANAQTSTMDLNEKAYQDYNIVNNKMLKTYQKMLVSYEDFDMNGNAKKALIEGQKAFISYREKMAKFYEAKYVGGSMLPLFKYKALKKLTEDRVKQLEFDE